MAKNAAAMPVEGAAYGVNGACRSWLHTRGPVRHINTLRTLAMTIGSVSILAIGTTGCASDEESDEKGEPAPVEAPMSTEVTEGTADETSPAAEEAKGDETSEAKDEETSEAEAE